MARRAGQAGSAELVRVQVGFLATLLHRRWSLAVLSELRRGEVAPGGARFITLVNRLGIGRDTLADTLEHLIAHDFVLRNPGHGHPMRPEYLLAERGHDIAPAAGQLLAAIAAADLGDLLLRKWSIPVLAAVHAGVGRFRGLRSALGGITARALAMALKDLAAAGLLEREVFDAHPPMVQYRHAPAARGILKRIEGLVRAAC